MHEGRVAYVLKGYPRRSELFISSEIWRLEQLGVPLRLYVLKPADEPIRHAVVDRVVAVPSYLPATSSLSAQPLGPWLRRNAGPFLPSVTRMARRHPWRLARAAMAAAAQSVRAHKGWRPRKIYVKELLQAIMLADRVEQAGDVAHLHAHFAHGTTTVTWLAAMLCRLPFSFTAHAKDVYLESLNPAGLLARKMQAASFVVTCTAANADHLRRLAPSADVHLVHHGLNADFARHLVDPPPRSFVSGDLLPLGDERTGGQRFRVVSVGRLVAKKGFDTLVEAVGELRQRGMDLELVIAGEPGEEGPGLRRLIRGLGLDDAVTLVGPVSQAELAAWYRRSHAFALACRVTVDGDRDGIPNVMVEAMAAGLPVVSTAISGILELVDHGVNGLLVRPDDPGALADAILVLAKDPCVAERLAAAGRATVLEHFDGDRLARRMGQLFRRGR